MNTTAQLHACSDDLRNLATEVERLTRHHAYRVKCTTTMLSAAII